MYRRAELIELRLGAEEEDEEEYDDDSAVNDVESRRAIKPMATRVFYGMPK